MDITNLNKGVEDICKHLNSALETELISHPEKVLKDSFNDYIQDKEVRLLFIQLNRETVLAWKVNDILEKKNFNKTNIKVK